MSKKISIDLKLFIIKLVNSKTLMISEISFLYNVSKRSISY